MVKLKGDDDDDDDDDSGGFNEERLQAAVTVDAMMSHMQALQDVADISDGRRNTGDIGYQLSLEYVLQVLEDAGYDVQIQIFEFPLPVDLGGSEMFITSAEGSATVFTYNVDFRPMLYSPNGTVEAMAQTIPGFGCDPFVDFIDFIPGNIAVMERGMCSLIEKALFAEFSGASGVVVYNTEDEVFDGSLLTLEPPFPVTIPVFSASKSVGKVLSNEEEGVMLFMFADTKIKNEPTAMNLIAELPGASETDDQVVMVGAHLDSVFEGPGIQDNGSGSSSILEIAIQIAELGVKTRNTVRFAWWGVEEVGLIGSDLFVKDLSVDEVAAIRVYLNLDMVASPNFVRIVHEPFSAAERPVGQVLVDYFRENDLAVMDFDDNEFPGNDGDSDHASFQKVGIPTGGLHTGTNRPKSEAHAEIYGGTAGVEWDPCYHKACDTIDNVNTEVFGQMTGAAIHAILKWANQEVLNFTVTSPTSRRVEASNIVEKRRGRWFLI